MPKMSKTAIYAKYGIKYDSKKKKIFSPINGGMWISPLLVDGNGKIGKGAFHFSALPGNIEYHLNIAFTKAKKTCEKENSPLFGKLVEYTTIDNDNPVFVDVKGTCACLCKNENGEITCYAFKGNYQYKTTLAYLAIRTIIAREYMDFCERAIIAQIEADKIHLCRIHAAGDFFNDSYAAMWKRIVTACTNTVFWTYTKIAKYETLFDGLVNGNIVKSIIPGFGYNYGHCDYIMNLYHILKKAGKKVHICFCGVEKYANIPVKHCTNCKSCSECDYVLFIEHSTKYQAEKDVLFPTLVALILSQEENIEKAA